MTMLERIIQARVQEATALAISNTTERIAGELVREILDDATFREEMRTLISHAFTQTIRDWTRNGNKTNRTKKKKRLRAGSVKTESKRHDNPHA